MSIHDVRKLGREYCQTDGSQHYRENSIDPIEYAIANGMIEDFCLINIVKYASRFKHTRKLDDLKKVSDYSHILAGVELEKQGAEVVKTAGIKSLKACENCGNTVISNEGRICWFTEEKQKICKASDYCFWGQDKPKKTNRPDNKGLLTGCFTCGNRSNRFSDGCNLSYRKAAECRGENLKHYVSEDAVLGILGSEVTD